MGTSSQGRSGVKAVLLDFDDTIVDMRDASYLAFNDVLRKHGLRTVSFEEMLANWDTSWRDYIRGLAAVGVDIDSLMQTIGREYMEGFSRIHLKHSKILLGVPEVLMVLHEMGVLIAIVSRRDKRVIEEELDKFNLRQYISCIVGRDSVERQKPAPDAFLLAADVLEVPIEECLVVGDSPSDIRAGKASGAKTVAVLTGPYEPEKVLREGPDIVLNSVVDLLDFVKSLS